MYHTLVLIYRFGWHACSLSREATNESNESQYYQISDATSGSKNHRKRWNFGPKPCLCHMPYRRQDMGRFLEPHVLLYIAQVLDIAIYCVILLILLYTGPSQDPCTCAAKSRIICRYAPTFCLRMYIDPDLVLVYRFGWHACSLLPFTVSFS